MAKALVKAITGVTPEQFRTDWSQFIKQAIAINRMMCPASLTLDKSDAKLSVLPAMPEAMVNKADPADPCWIGVYIHDNDNAWQGEAFNVLMGDFAAACALTPGTWLQDAAAREINVTASKFTALTAYDVLIVVSDQEITTEVAENTWDKPYSFKGAAVEMTFSVTCAA
mgnify:CR=1 FL=1